VGSNGSFPSYVNHHVLLIGNGWSGSVCEYDSLHEPFSYLKRSLWCWGTLWSPPAFGWGTSRSPAALGSGGAGAGKTSDSRNMLMVDVWHLSNGGTMAQAGCRRCGSEVHAMTVSAWLHSFSSGTLVVCIVLSRHAWSRCRTSYWCSQLSSSILDDKVDSPGSSLSQSLISRSGSSPSYFIQIRARTVPISNILLEGWVGSSNIWLGMKIGCLLECMCKCSLTVCFLIVLWLVIPHLAGRGFHVDEVKLGNLDRSI